MEIQISNIIRIKNPSDKILEHFKKKLTYTNPAYSRLKNMGYSVYKVPKEIKLYNIWEDSLYIPVGCFEDLYSLHPVANDYIDYCINKPINIEYNVDSNITLRDYQQEREAKLFHCRLP